MESKIEKLNKRGWGLGTGPKPCEVIGGVIGDTLLVDILSKRRGRVRGVAKEVLSPSPLRVVPRCAHAPRCGGCTWQQIDYAAQLEEKQRRMLALFTPWQEVLRPIIACRDPWAYRNKMEFSFSQNKAGEQFLGLVLAGSKGYVFNVTECHLVSPWFTEVLNRVRAWWKASGLSAYRMNNTGSLRSLILREGKRTGDRLAMLTVSGNPDFALTRQQLREFVSAVQGENPEKLSIFLRIQQIQKGAPTEFYEMHLFGPDHLTEKLLDLEFKISPTSFFQPNTIQAERLYAEALSLVSFPKKHALDLYAGTATLGMAMAKKAEKVTSIELNPHACFDAESNRERNQLDNLKIICGDVGKVLEEICDSVDLVIVDPPRAGLDPTALGHLKRLNAEEILYISCNPETQVENIRELVASGYRLKALQPVDQFPHTPHIENIALMERISP
ncbi:MAG: 23S rRNA (uracil(1939)-C(5))-methyltransferase RlmD [Verrucomicrobia bacterium]|nr:23S rRNA (uracil(1939)-C(5))-methyltransferase RlmD [Verrucomicrobiota bacterium]